MVVVGDGGKYVEAMPDARVLLPPFDEEDVARALGTAAHRAAAHGVRGEPPLDVAAFCEAAVAVGSLMGCGARLINLDLNPVIVAREGRRAMRSWTRWRFVSPEA